jgi:hypothetical protein
VQKLYEWLRNARGLHSRADNSRQRALAHYRKPALRNGAAAGDRA